MEITLPYDGKILNSDEMFEIIKIQQKYNCDTDKMLEDNIITQTQWIKETFYFCLVLLDWQNLKRYNVVKIGEESIYKDVEDFNSVNYRVIDTKKLKKVNDDRHTNKYKIWRTSVFERDNYTCKHCNKIGGKLNAHHIKDYKNFKKLRYILSNGITLCIKCHILEHKRLRGIKT
jgi:hypothetical protein